MDWVEIFAGIGLVFMMVFMFALKRFEKTNGKISGFLLIIFFSIMWIAIGAEWAALLLT